VTLIHVESQAEDQEHPLPVLTATVPDPPAAGKFFPNGDIWYAQFVDDGVMSRSV